MSVAVWYVVVVKAMDAQSENPGAITAQNPYILYETQVVKKKKVKLAHLI